MGKKVILDAGPIISLTTNNLLFLLEEFKEKYSIDFYITKGVRRELVEKPLQTKKFKFEALQVLEYIKKGIIDIFEEKNLKEETLNLLTLANNIFFVQESPIAILHYAEVESLISYYALGADAFVIDERTTRVLIEDPEKLRDILKSRLHTKVRLDAVKLEKFKNSVNDINLFRSAEFSVVAYESGMLDRFLPEGKDAKKVLLESVLWGLKLNGCAISKEEIDVIINKLAKK